VAPWSTTAIPACYKWLLGQNIKSRCYREVNKGKCSVEIAMDANCFSLVLGVTRRCPKAKKFTAQMELHIWLIKSGSGWVPIFSFTFLL